MTDPAGSSTPVAYFDPSLLGVGRYASGGSKWGDALGTGVTLTVSFPGNGTAGNVAYSSDPYGSAAVGVGGSIQFATLINKPTLTFSEFQVV
jgi:hypothetical protein